MSEKHITDRALEYIGAALMIALVLLVFIQVFARYFGFDIPMWSGEEVTTCIFIWMANIGAGIAAARSAHISVDFLISKFSPRYQLLNEIFVTIITCSFLLFFAYISFKLAWKGRLSSTPRLGIPMMVLQISIPISSLLMFSFYFRSLFKSSRKLSVKSS